MDTNVPFAARGAVFTHAGKVRGRNEDCCAFGGLIIWGGLTEPVNALCAANAPWLMAVADGIGGQSAGERASREVIYTLANCRDYSEAILAESLGTLNERLVEIGRTSPSCAGLGATVAGIACGAGGLLAFNVGDARVYRQQDQYLRQITTDDSIAQMLVQAGAADAAEIRAPSVHRITQAIGGRLDPAPIEPHIERLRLTAPCRFLLCTDGLTDMLAIDHMEQFVSANGSAASAVSDLFSAAMEAGGEDNTTIIIADIHPAASP